MTIQTVGLLSPGDMGHSIGAVLHDHGLRVITCFEGRSERSRTLAAEAGIEDGGSMDDVVQAADIFLSVLVPASAREVAGRVAASLRATGSSLLYVDCNAVSPATVREVAETITAAGGEIADVGIVGPPPRKPGTRFYASGPGAERLTELREFGLDIRVIGDEIGQASGLKMCYGAMTKGLTALATELLVAAKLMGLEDVLRAEQESSMTEVLGWVAGMTPTMPPKAYRWVGEMEEIAATFADLGMTPNILTGAADMYRFIAETPIGKETPETRDPNRDLDGVIAALAESLRETTPAS